MGAQHEQFPRAVHCYKSPCSICYGKNEPIQLIIPRSIATLERTLITDANMHKNNQDKEQKKAFGDLKRLEKLQQKSAEKRKREADKVQTDQKAIPKQLDEEKKARNTANDATTQKMHKEEAQMWREMAAEKEGIVNASRTKIASGEVDDDNDDTGKYWYPKDPTTQNAVHQGTNHLSHHEYPSLPRKPCRQPSHNGSIVAEIKQLIVGKVNKTTTVKAKTGISQYKPMFPKQKEKEKERETSKDPSSPTSPLRRQLSKREQQHLGFINQLDHSPETPSSPSSPTSPDPNSSYTVISGSGRFSVHLSSTVYDASGEGVSELSLFSMIDENYHVPNGINRKSNHELAMEEAEWRDQAEQARMMVREAFARAGQQKLGAVAGHIASKGHEWRHRMYEYGNHAARCQLLRLNPGVFIVVNSQGGLEYRGFEVGRSGGGITKLQMDLHGLRVREAKELVLSIIEYYTSISQNHLTMNRPLMVLRLIVGRGAHSIEKKGVLGPALKQLFNQHDIQVRGFDESNGGEIEVIIKTS